jgi:hypothetical protein
MQYTNWWDPFPDPAYAGALVHQAALYFLLNQITQIKSKQKITIDSNELPYIFIFTISFQHLKIIQCRIIMSKTHQWVCDLGDQLNVLACILWFQIIEENLLIMNKCK